MRISWKLFGMDKLKAGHLKANLEYWRMDTLLEADKVMQRIDKSRSLKLLSKANQALQNGIAMVKMKGETAKDIDNLINYTISVSDDFVLFDLFVNEVYFVTSDQMRAQVGRRMARVMKTFGRQELIDKFEDEIKSTYTKRFQGSILEDDGIDLRITKDAI